MLQYFLRKIFGSRNEREVKRHLPLVQAINAREEHISKCSDEELRNMTAMFREKLANGATLDDILVDAFAVVREASKRAIGLRHFDVQLLGGMILNEGKIAEMRTGEGKTLVATLPAYLRALTGKGVHVVTVNDYLAKRDSEWMGPVYTFLGLTIGTVQNDMDHEERQAGYKCDITYVTNNEIGFDYLRDNMVVRKEDRVLRNTYFAIVDEVDSILVDEARTPLIISGPAEKSTEKYHVIDKIIPMLKARFVTESEQIDAKHKNIDLSVGYDYLVDEKAGTATLTTQGITKCERILGIQNLYDDISSEWVHHINQALRAHNLYHRDVEYVVKDGEVIIVDEFTGRLMPGRRWSDGLHQAVEAKEKLQIAEENQTLATITFQNFFRMYEKLSGMTGTALTEANEFWEIYKLDVMEIPTNQTMIRKDFADVIYRTEREKFDAVVHEIEEMRTIGRPVLVGTRSIEKSEKLSALLRRKGVPHQVLNAKYHETEAQIIAQAGRKGNITIATNMAGRGTDIVLGGNPQIKEEAAQVVEAGGLHIIGTERHESRRIDNQLRGRSGRQGDPGSSRFYLALDDELMRLFGSDRIARVMDRLGLEEGQDIQHPLISRAIESAQRRVEGTNFDIRKQLLEYDNVMNKQREVAYTQRNVILDSENLHDLVYDLIDEVVREKFDMFIPPKSYRDLWDVHGLKEWTTRVTGAAVVYDDDLTEQQVDIFKDNVAEAVKQAYQLKETEVGLDMITHLQRIVMLQVLDNCWKEHLYNLDQVKRGIGLRAYGQKDPIIEYKHESFSMFINMINRVKEETVEYLFRATFVQEPTRPPITMHATSNDQQKQPSKPHSLSRQKQAPLFEQNQRDDDDPLADVKNKIGRNDPCPCGSGKKYKKCCGQ